MSSGPAHNVVFDLDGTLVDSAPGIFRCLGDVLAKVAPGQVPEYPADLIGPPVRDMVARLLADADDTAIDLGVAIFRRCYDGGGWQDTVPYAGVDDALVALSSAGYRLFIVTNKPCVPTERILEHLGWGALFEDVVCRDSVSPPFSDKSAALGHLMERYSLEASGTIFVGDTRDDEAAAASQGLAFLCAAYGYGDEPLAEKAQAIAVLPSGLAAAVRGAVG
jgi:phosphoglycolate phosphatase